MDPDNFLAMYYVLLSAAGAIGAYSGALLNEALPHIGLDELRGAVLAGLGAWLAIQWASRQIFE